MTRKVVRVGLLTCFLIGPTLASAEQIRPECAKMLDKIGCTCALNNGGGINNGRWYSVRGRGTHNGGLPNQAFIKAINVMVADLDVRGSVPMRARPQS